MKKRNILKTLVFMLAFAAMPVSAASVHAEDVSAPAAEAIVYEEAQTTTALTTVTTSATTVADLTTTTTTLSAETTSGTAATTADASATTTVSGDATTTSSEAAATTTTTFNPNRIAVEDVKLNATEADIAAGRTFQIKADKIPFNATDNVVLRFISSDESIATVDSKGVVTAIKPGEVTITVIADSMIPVVQDKTLESYTVLVLDNSTSMSGDPMTAQKEAAIKFCSDAILSNTGTDYKFAIVSFGSKVQVASEFTNDIAKLTEIINGIKLQGSTNYTIALNKAAELLSQVSQNAVKNIVFCSDGLPNQGDSTANGPFTSSDNKYYEYANSAVNKTNELKAQGINVYTLGFFHKMNATSQKFANRLMNDMASSPSMSYIVNDPKQLSSVFSEVSNSVVNYNRVGSFKKAVEVKVKPAAAATAKKAQSPSQKSENGKDSPKTGDINHNAALITVICISAAAAFTARKTRKTDK